LFPDPLIIHPSWCAPFTLPSDSSSPIFSSGQKKKIVVLEFNVTLLYYFYKKSIVIPGGYIPDTLWVTWGKLMASFTRKKKKDYGQLRFL
jgi:hypothetical protein